ncbi:hypothetical protein [Pseudomonas aeruginosa]|uniref:hypothetical protein n=1 Tax=Pseudomonas aeruginosa TaxID=287 RepID=UPI001ABC20CA|nr:hypothetical protein [Pseudomonas aeruginosa]
MSSACLTVLAACAHAGAAEPDWRGYTSEQQQRSVLAVEQDAEAINKRYYDSAFEEFLPELEQLELSLAQPAVAVDEKGLLGDWKCRSTQADQYGIYRYPNFQCRIRRTDQGCSGEDQRFAAGQRLPVPGRCRALRVPRWRHGQRRTPGGLQRAGGPWRAGGVRRGRAAAPARRRLPPAVPGTARRLRVLEFSR